jgi:hypothetical protein
MARLVELFRDLTPPAENSPGFSVRRLARNSKVWVGQDSLARPVVLIESTSDATRAHGAVLRNITFEPWVSCEITESASPLRSVMASIIRCTAAERELHEHFLRALSPACEELGEEPRVAEVAGLVDRLIEVFRALSQPSSESIQGLWTELLLINRARDIELAVQAWQPRSRSLVDFEHGTIGVEVKSCAGQVRLHRFKLAQLQPATGSERYVASVLVSPNARGASISDLWDVIESRLGSRRLLRDRTAARIAEALGDDWQRAHAHRFDVDSAVAALLMFDAQSIPRVGQDAEPCLTDIEFTVDLSGVDPVELQQLAIRGPLLHSLVSGLRG